MFKNLKIMQHIFYEITKKGVILMRNAVKNAKFFEKTCKFSKKIQKKPLF